MEEYNKLVVLDETEDPIAAGKLTRILNDKEIILDLDKEEVSEEVFFIGRPVQVKIFNNEKGLLFYSGEIVYHLRQRIHVGNLTLVSCIQRRNDLKVPMSAFGVMELMRSGESKNLLGSAPKKPEERRKENIQFRDISAGGTCFIIKGEEKRFHEGDMIRSIFKFGRAPITLDMKILRETEEGDDTYSYGCQFIGLSMDEEQIIREFVFGVQVALRRGNHKDK